MITGSSSGLGEAIAKLFKAKGFKIIGVCRSEPKVEVDLWLKADVTKTEDCREIFEKTLEKFDHLDVLVNAAGKGNYGTWAETKEEDLRGLFELNFFSIVNMSTIFLPLLQKCKGTLINISSIAGKIYVPCMGPYCATKHAVFVFSDSLRAEIKSSGVRVLVIAPGRIHTEFSKNSVGPRDAPPTPKFGSTAEGLAKRVYKGYKCKWRSLIYPRIYIVYFWISRVFPRFYDWANRKAWGIK